MLEQHRAHQIVDVDVSHRLQVLDWLALLFVLQDEAAGFLHYLIPVDTVAGQPALEVAREFAPAATGRQIELSVVEHQLVSACQGSCDACSGL